MPKKEEIATIDTVAAQTPEEVIKALKDELKAANIKMDSLNRVVEALSKDKQYLADQLNAERAAHKNTTDYMLDCIKHAYISANMAVKGGNL